MANLIKVSNLSDAIRSLKSLKLDVTLSLAYHGLIHGDVSALSEFRDNAIVNEMHRDYKALIPASWNKKDNCFSYNKAKAVKLQERFGLVFQETTFEEFCDAVCQENDKEDKPAKTEQELREAACLSVSKALVKALSLGIDKATLTILVNMAQPK